MSLPSRLVALSAFLGGSAHAFCGFYVAGGDAKLFNDATQVVLMREGTRTVLSMQNAYAGPPEDFALVVPVPVVLQKENVRTLDKKLFVKLDKFTAPRLVEYWEQDPCPKETGAVYGYGSGTVGMAYGAGYGVGYGGGRGSVRVEARFEVAEYDIVILSAEDALGLDQWLKENKYKIPEGAEPFFRPYVQQGLKFFVAKVNPKRLTFESGRAVLSPLRFHYDSEQFSLPVRLGLINAQDKQDLIVHVLARQQRYEVANAPNVTIPTNIDLVPSAKNEFGPFYVSLFDRTLKQTPGAVVTEYAWDATSCDPCPGPAPTADDYVALGLDVMGTATAPLPEIEVKNLAKLPAAEQQLVQRHLDQLKRVLEAQRGRGRAAGWVITRLHARYDKSSLGEDLVFRAAPPIAGGRESLQGDDGALEQGALPSANNQFQGRYAVRYPWTKPITCKNPQRGVWGGPWNVNAQEPDPLAATDTVRARRDRPLELFAEGPIPELKVAGKKPRSGALPLRRGAK